MKPLLTLWQFSRPHTIIGSFISILTLYYIICANRETQPLSYLVIALSIGVSCNVFIVGINQIADVQIDKINKPHLPLASGVLSIGRAKVIVFTALIVSLGLALFISPWLFGIVACSGAIGWAYSMPPFYWKQHHVTAALSITMVRGVLLNAGGFLVFNHLVNQRLEMPMNVVILTVFIILFSVAISWFKDLPDIAGDAAYNIRTFAILRSPRFVLRAGIVLVSMAYLFTICLKWMDFTMAKVASFETRVLLSGHVLLLGLFLVNARMVRLGDSRSVRLFYTRFWWFFFAEYVLYLLAYAGNR